MLARKLEEVIDEMILMRRDAEKATAGNVSAGVRLRKDARVVEAMLKQLRKDVLTSRAERKEVVED